MAKRSRKPKDLPPLRARQPAPTLEQIVEQRRAIEIVSRAVSADRVHHAWLFHGPGGVGKFTTAMAFAIELLSPQGPERERVRALAIAGQHPDLHVISKELAVHSRDEKVREAKQRVIPKEVIAEFFIEPSQRSAQMSSGSPAAKVFIVDEAELLAAPGQNSILKTMEEPSAGTVIILVTKSEERLLPTIRSRCQRIAFTPLSGAALRVWSERTHPDLALAQRDWLLEAADGSPGEFAALVESGAVAWREMLKPMLHATAQGKFSADLGAAMAKLMDERAKAVVGVGENASKEAANRAAAGQLFRVVAGELRRELRSRLDRGEGPGWCLRGIDAVRESERVLDANVPALFAFERLAVELSRA